MKSSFRRRRQVLPTRSAFFGFQFPAEVITVAVRWYLRYVLSYRAVEELLAEGDHVTVYRWVQRFTPLFADAARFARHVPGDRWFVDEDLCLAGQVTDVLVSVAKQIIGVLGNPIQVYSAEMFDPTRVGPGVRCGCRRMRR